MKGADIVKHTSTYNWDPLNKYINSVIQFSFPSSRSSMNMQGCTLIISEDPIEINYIKYIQINNFPSLSPLPSGTFRYIPQKVTATSHSSGITQPLPIQTFWVGIKILFCVVYPEPGSRRKRAWVVEETCHWSSVGKYTIGAPLSNPWGSFGKQEVLQLLTTDVLDMRKGDRT